MISPLKIVASENQRDKSDLRQSLIVESPFREAFQQLMTLKLIVISVILIRPIRIETDPINVLGYALP